MKNTISDIGNVKINKMQALLQGTPSLTNGKMKFFFFAWSITARSGYQPLDSASPAAGLSLAATLMTPPRHLYARLHLLREIHHCLFSSVFIDECFLSCMRVY